MDHDLELIIPILEILEIEVFIFPRILEILEIPVFQFSTILEILEIEVSIIPRILEIRAGGGGQAEAGGRLQGLCCAALDYFWNMFPGISGYPGNVGNVFLSILVFFQKRRAPKFHAECTGQCPEISHMRPIQARKLKLFQTPISK